MIKTYTWMSPQQLNLYIRFCKAFRTSTLSEIGRMLQLKNPYHSTYQIFKTKAPNKYLEFAIKAKIDQDYCYFDIA